jgi:alcohol dehydrogenase class IV
MSYDSEISFEYFAPTKVIFGVGSIAELPMTVAALGKKALLVTDAGLTDAGLVDGIKDLRTVEWVSLTEVPSWRVRRMPM